jgi:hypothetical protein
MKIARTNTDKFTKLKSVDIEEKYGIRGDIKEAVEKMYKMEPHIPDTERHFTLKLSEEEQKPFEEAFKQEIIGQIKNYFILSAKKTPETNISIKSMFLAGIGHVSLTKSGINVSIL